MDNPLSRKKGYPGFTLFREDPVIGGMIREGKIEGEFKGMRVSPQLVAQVQQAITPVQDVQLLRKFHRQLFGVSDE
jgi:hypothetical protein